MSLYAWFTLHILSLLFYCVQLYSTLPLCATLDATSFLPYKHPLHIHALHLRGMTYILQVIALGLASHKHRYAQSTASGKSSIMNLHLVHIHTYMAKVHMNSACRLMCVQLFCIYSFLVFTIQALTLCTVPFCPLPSEWLDCSSGCSSLWPQGSSARAV